MNKTTGLLLLASAGVILFFLSRKNAAKFIKAYFLTVDIQRGQFIAKFKIVNPSNTPVEIKGITGEIYVNGKLLAMVNNFIATTIPANNQIIYPIKIETTGLSLATTIYSLFKNRQPLKFNFEGNINTTGVLVPIKQEIKL